MASLAARRNVDATERRVDLSGVDDVIAVGAAVGRPQDRRQEQVGHAESCDVGHDAVVDQAIEGQAIAELHAVRRDPVDLRSLIDGGTGTHDGSSNSASSPSIGTPTQSGRWSSS